MHQRQRLFVLSVFSCIALGLAAQAEPDPQAKAPSQAVATASAGDLLKVPEHWSKWQYPKEITVPSGCQLYLVEKGDCLWNLGQRFLGNPFSWPQIWEQNKWIADPHWIYPGDPLVIPVDRKAMGEAGQTPETPAEVAGLKPERMRLSPRPVPEEYAFTMQDFLQLPYMAPQGAEAAMKEAGALQITQRRARERNILGDREVVYLSGGEDKGLKADDKLLIVKVRSRNLRHPYASKDDKTTMGDVLEQVGVIKIANVKPKGAVAVIDRSVDVVEVGDYVIPYTEPENILAKPRTDVEGEVTLQEPLATICYTRDDRMNTGLGHMVVLDKGSKDGFQVGDMLMMARTQSWAVGENAVPRTMAEERAMAKETRGAFDRFVKRVETGRQDAIEHEKTNYYLGQMMVVRAAENTCTCRIIRSSEEVMVGDVGSK